jgi:Siphovirus Gp157
VSGAKDAALALRTDVLANYDALKDRVADVSKAVIRLRAAEDLLAVMAAADAYSLACEALAEITKATHAAADAALAQTMSETGAPSLRTEFHTISLRKNPERVEITDPKAIPDSFMTVPKPQPDRSKIRAAIKNDPAINWANLQPGSLTLQRKPIS